MEMAVADYRSALAQEAEFPNAKSRAWLDFGWLVIKNGGSAHYDEVLNVLHSRESEALFPVDFFQMNAIRAIIASERGQRREARDFASAALLQSTRTDSGLRRHRDIGLVTDSFAATIGRLKEIENG
jgi:hypothetical protein